MGDKKVRVSDELHEYLRKEAFNKRTTMKDILEKALEEHIEAEA